MGTRSKGRYRETDLTTFRYADKPTRLVKVRLRKKPVRLRWHPSKPERRAQRLADRNEKFPVSIGNRRPVPRKKTPEGPSEVTLEKDTRRWH